MKDTVQRPVLHPGFGLDTVGVDHAGGRARGDPFLDHGRAPDPGLAAENQRGTPAIAHIGDKALEFPQLLVASDEKMAYHGTTLGDHSPPRKVGAGGARRLATGCQLARSGRSDVLQMRVGERSSEGDSDGHRERDYGPQGAERASTHVVRRGHVRPTC